MFTLIEIFDSKQYENIISSISVSNISKIIYIGTPTTMTKEKVQSVKNFFNKSNSNITVEFSYVKRDNVDSVIETLEDIIRNNTNCILDTTGGEDVILVGVGIVAQKHSLPVIRTDIKKGKPTVIYGGIDSLSSTTKPLEINDFITLQGGQIVSSENIKVFSKSVAADIKALFRVNSANCESYSLFCSFISEFVSVEKQTILFNKNVIERKTERIKKAVSDTLNLLCKFNLLDSKPYGNSYFYQIKSRIIAVCLKKTGNILEYYTALALSEIPELFRDIRVGTTVEWNDNSNHFETQNEIDVMAVSNNLPVFISCKNGDIKKDALYEIDTVSRVLGGPYTQKYLVCTFLSHNKASKGHFIKRAHDMKINLIYDTHKMDYGEFQLRLRNSLK